jgi:NAD+ diphosphatase
MDFVPGVTPPASSAGPAWWLAFRDGRLLVLSTGPIRGERGASIPEAERLEQLGVRAVRMQYLGTLEGRPCYSAELPLDAPEPPGMALRELRSLFGALPEELFWLAGRAFQIMDWDRNHQFCGRCASPTQDKPGERVKVCQSCGLHSYPRISPAVIVAVIRGREILLARARRFAHALYSVIAGFVEAGESLEECVRRELQEEVGIQVRDLRYFGSQSWPFPNSLMVAFTAEYAGGELAPDPTELTDAGWFRADALPRIPERLSIARRLIDWFLEEQERDGR